MVPNTDPLPPPPPPPPPPPALAASRRGWFTSELAINLAVAILGALMVSGVVADGSVAAQIIGAILSIAASLGYGTQRAMTKSAEAKAVAMLADTAARERAFAADPTKRSRSTE